MTKMERVLLYVSIFLYLFQKRDQLVLECIICNKCTCVYVHICPKNVTNYCVSMHHVQHMYQALYVSHVTNVFVYSHIRHVTTEGGKCILHRPRMSHQYRLHNWHEFVHVCMRIYRRNNSTFRLVTHWYSVFDLTLHTESAERESWLVSPMYSTVCVGQVYVVCTVRLLPQEMSIGGECDKNGKSPVVCLYFPRFVPKM